MMKLTDGTRTVEIRIQRWNGSGYDPDWSNDFFEAGSLPYDEETDTYTVDDVDYCIDMAQTEARMKCDEDGNEVVDEDMCVFIEIKMDKTYYMPTTDLVTFYGSGEIVCIDAAERDRICGEWGMDPEDDFREATAEEIEEYGVYDSVAE